MTRICGIVDERPAPDLAKAFEGLCAASWGGDPGQRHTACEGRVGLGRLTIGAVNRSPQPVACLPERWRAVFCGKVFDTDGLRRKLKRDGVTFGSNDGDAPLVAQLVRRGRSVELARLNGIFSAAVWDADAETLFLVTDRYGIRPLYFHLDDRSGRLAFSSDLRGLSDSGMAPRQIDWHAAGNLLHFGHNLGDETLFRQIRRVPPGSVLAWRRGRVNVRPYWTTAEIQIDDRIGPEQAVDGMIQLFRQAMARRMTEHGGSTILLLSGGMDSRRIAGELRKLGVAFGSYTVGWDDQAPDPAVARRVAEALGVSHTLVELPRRGLMRTYWPQCARQVDFETKLHQWILPLLEVLPGDAKVNYDGLAGDIPANATRRGVDLTAKEQLALMERGDLEEMALSLVGPAEIHSGLSPELRRNLSHEASAEAVRQELARHGPTPNAMTFFQLFNRTRRAVALFALRLLSRHCESFFPFLDNDLFDFTMSIPPHVKVSCPLRAEVTRRAYPSLADIPYAKYTDRRGRKVSWEQHPLYRRERRLYLRQCFREFFLGHNWIFSNRHAGPRVLHDLMMARLGRRHVSTVFSESFVLFYRWLIEYFPGGLPEE